MFISINEFVSILIEWSSIISEIDFLKPSLNDFARLDIVFVIYSVYSLLYILFIYFKKNKFKKIFLKILLEEILLKDIH